MIKVLGVSKIYCGKTVREPDVKALDHVTFTLGNKGMVFILGKSGGGKSTLLNLLGGLDTIDAGDISVNGTLLSTLDGPALDSYRNTYVGFVFQEYSLLENKTVKENIALALSLQGKIDNKRIDEALEKVSMLEYAGRKASTLSGGQKQRIAIARAIVKNPALILADEPTGALDFETGTQIMNLLKELSSNQLVIVVSHDRSFAEKYGDRIIEIEDGKIIADSNSNESILPEEHLPLIKSKMRFSDTFGLAIKSFKSRVSRLALTSLLSIISFGSFGIMSATASWNKNEATFSSIKEAYNNMVSITLSNKTGPVLIPQKKVDEIRNEFKRKIFIKECVGVDIYGEEVASFSDFQLGPNNQGQLISYPNLGDYYTGKIYGYTHFEETDFANSGFSLEGRLPVLDDEIAITKYSYNYLKSRKGILTFEGTKVNLNINGSVNNDYKIVGVIDTQFNSKQYEDTNLRLYGDDRLEYRDFLLDELKNSFNGVIFLNENMFNYAKSRDDKQIDVISSEASTAVFQESITTSIDEIYEEFVWKKEEEYYRNNSEYFFIDYENNTIRLTSKWYEDNGYTFNSNNGTYVKTISGPEGDYEVVYDMPTNTRISEHADPTLIIPERADINISKRDFLNDQLFEISKSEIDSLLVDENTFATLNNNEVIAIVDNQYNPIYIDFANNKKDISFTLGDESLKANVKALFKRKDASENEITNKSFITNEATKQLISKNASGYYRLIAKLSSDPVINKKFFDYCTREKYLDASFTLANISETAIVEIDSFLSGPLLSVALTFSVFLALFSSLILMNFISISMSYGRKEMGILRALGAKNSDILLVYLLESLLIAFINGIFAFSGTLIACSVINSRIASFYAVSVKVLSFSLMEPLVIFGASIVSSLLAAAFPILKNRKKKPIEILTNR